METKWSSNYMRSGLGKARPRPYYYFLLRSLKLNNSILEVGTGPGLFTEFLLSHGDYNYSGCDLTSEMLEEVRGRHPQLNLFECDVMNMHNVEDNSYDWVICSDVLIHIPDPYKALQELWRVTKGALLFVVRSSEYPQDIVDKEISYQEEEGVKYFYNIFNEAKMIERLSGLSPTPQKISSHINPIYGNHLEHRRHINIDLDRYPARVAAYALLKDPEGINWISEGHIYTDNKNLVHRLKRGIRKATKSPHAWDLFTT